MAEITDVEAWEVLDSRGHPTVRVAVRAGSARGEFGVPAGASTGAHEAVERRDGGDRYGGLGVRGAIEAIDEELAPVVRGRDVTNQRGIDAELVAADGTESLSRLGANAVLGVSGAVLRAGSEAAGVPLYRYVGELVGNGDTGRLPTPMVNIISGGLHATGGIEIQDFLAVPVGASDFEEALETAWTVRRAVRDRIVDAGHRPLVADEGGFAPPLDDVTEAFELLTGAIRDAGYTPGTDVALAVDVAASHFYDPETERYRLERLDRMLGRDGMVAQIREWCDAYPLVSVEDPLHEDDWEGFERLVDELDDSVQVVGDDLLVTDLDRLERAIERDAATAVLVKPNQTGTVSRTLDVVERARAASVAPIVSARSGETCDSTIADLAVGTAAGRIKIGSLARSERLAKYNRLLKIAGDRTTSAHEPP